MNKTEFESWTGEQMFGETMVIEAVPTEQLQNFIKNFHRYMIEKSSSPLAYAISNNNKRHFDHHFNSHRKDFDNVTNELIRRANNAISDDSDNDSDTTSVSDEVSTNSGV